MQSMREKFNFQITRGQREPHIEFLSVDIKSSYFIWIRQACTVEGQELIEEHHRFPWLEHRHADHNKERGLSAEGINARVLRSLFFRAVAKINLKHVASLDELCSHRLMHSSNASRLHKATHTHIHTQFENINICITTLWGNIKHKSWKSLLATVYVFFLTSSVSI